MTDLRKAAEQALEALEWINRVNAMDYEYQRKAQEPIQALRQALAQPEEKMRIEGSGKLTTKPYPDGYESERDFRKALAQPEQEPVAWGFRRKDGAILDIKNADEHEGYEKIYTVPLYTTPSNREWVGLTKEEFEQAVDGLEDLEDCWAQIEAKLKEKNT